MIKRISIIFILTILISLAYSTDLTNDLTNDVNVRNYIINVNSSGFLEFLKNNIGQQISIYIKGADITFRGELVELYPDGLTILTFFKQKIYIPKESIGYIETKKEEKKK